MGSQSVPTYDYIICGGGTAGCALASRLAEDSNISVLIIEAGGPRDSVPASELPAGTWQIVGTDADWKIFSEPCTKLDDRKLNLIRGKFVGGSSGANGTLCIRGSRADYDGWNIPGWSGKDMFERMKKVERYEGQPWFQADEAEHGRDGPIGVSPHKNAPISDLVTESYISKGFPMDPDMFSTGKTPHGCGNPTRTISRGRRTFGSDYIQGDNAKSNITVETHATVDTIIFEKTEGGLRATGVNIINILQPLPVKSQAYVRKEVLVCGGAYGSPPILLRSGIGPRSELDKHGIECRVELQGVGRNLEDHLILINNYEINKPKITNDHLLWHEGAAEKSLNQWKIDQTGVMSQFPFGSFLYARIGDRLQDSALWQNATRSDGRDQMGTLPGQPHIEIWNTEFCLIPSDDTLMPFGGESAFAMVIELFNQRSRGEVTLPDRDPLKNPVVDHRFMTDELDMLVLSEGCRLANEIAMEGKGTKDLIVGSWPRTKQFHKYHTREEWVPEIRERADVCYHPSGTCKMGVSSDSDPTAVVDPELRVFGVQGLRVVDASIMPKLPCGHPQMAVYAIAEKAADMIKGSVAKA